eukprot:2826835-Rhodomonas_salina.1
MTHPGVQPEGVQTEKEDFSLPEDQALLEPEYGRVLLLLSVLLPGHLGKLFESLRDWALIQYFDHYKILNCKTMSCKGTTFKGCIPAHSSRIHLKSSLSAMFWGNYL